MTRRAWLTLEGRRIDLDNPHAGYFVTSMEIGYPEVREVSSGRPDQHGLDDRTRLFGGRTITVEITALRGANARLDHVATSFGPFMRVDTRPEFHYQLEDAGGERVLVVRPANYSWPIIGADERQIQLQFVAADPVALDPALKVAIAHVGSESLAGRTYPKHYNRLYPGGALFYPLTFPREYPAPTADATTGIITSPGDIPVRPLVRVHGPITGPLVRFITAAAQVFAIPFTGGARIDAGHYVEIDTIEKTAYLDGDRNHPVLELISWDHVVWPVLPPGNIETFMNLYGAGTSAVSQSQALWRDGYLS